MAGTTAVRGQPSLLPAAHTVQFGVGIFSFTVIGFAISFTFAIVFRFRIAFCFTNAFAIVFVIGIRTDYHQLLPRQSTSDYALFDNDVAVWLCYLDV